VTVVAIVNLFSALALVATKTFLAVQPPQDDALILLVVLASLSVGLSLAFLKLQNWARWIFVVVYIILLIRIPGRVIAGGDLLDIIGVLLGGLFEAWAVWYLFRTHVKAAFGDT
jgi:hypothetical protein